MDTKQKIILIKWAKRILKIFVSVLGFQFIVFVLNYLYVDGEPWYRIMWHHYYDDEGKIDCIILGSSHVYCDINPALLDSESNNFWFNLASPGQRLSDSYYLLREADSGNGLSNVYIELYYVCSTKDNFKDGVDPIQDEDICNRSLQNIDCMKMSYNKLAYMFSILDKEIFTELFFPFCRYRAKLDDWDYVRQTIKKREKNIIETLNIVVTFRMAVIMNSLNKDIFFQQGNLKRVCLINQGYWMKIHWEIQANSI